jgi:shikimate kinase
MAELRRLLSERQPLYASADHTIQTSGRTIDAVVNEIQVVLRPTLEAVRPSV